VTVHYGPRGPGLTALIAIVFLFLTVPTGSHLIARAAGRMGVAPLRERGEPVAEEPAGGTSEAADEAESASGTGDGRDATGSGTSAASTPE
jgi:multicomponent Na+:H+ antiporter subunit G